jgi:hypothetical protein
MALECFKILYKLSRPCLNDLVVPQGANNLILRTFFVARLIINQINKLQWVDFKLENVLTNLKTFHYLGMEMNANVHVKQFIINLSSRSSIFILFIFIYFLAV